MIYPIIIQSVSLRYELWFFFTALRITNIIQRRLQHFSVAITCSKNKDKKRKDLSYYKLTKYLHLLWFQIISLGTNLWRFPKSLFLFSVYSAYSCILLTPSCATESCTCLLKTPNPCVGFKKVRKVFLLSDKKKVTDFVSKLTACTPVW